MYATDWINGFLICRGCSTRASAAIGGLTNGKKITGRDRTGSWDFTVTTATSTVNQFDNSILDWTITVQSGTPSVNYLFYIDFPLLVPTSSTSPGVMGQIAYDATYIYMCVAANTWRRWAASTF